MSTQVSVEVIAEVVRSGFVEGHHYGSTVVLDAEGEVVEARGDVESPILPRSCNKPIQALGMLHAGLDLGTHDDLELLALVCASHSGEPFHVEGVRRILAGAGLDESALQTPPDYPLDDEARDAWIRSGGGKEPVLMNCSGKHAGMLATCVVNGWPTESYRDPEHPLQQQIIKTFGTLTGEPVEHVAVDGCGAPLLGTSLVGLARAFGRIARGVGGLDKLDHREQPDEHSHRVAEAIRGYPSYVSGSTRDELTLLTAIPGAVGKAGAESCYVVALPDGRAFALKTDDGAARARPPVMAALLERHGVTAEAGVDAEAVRRSGAQPLLGGGVPVGEIRAV